jgi:hypothetical protein
MTNATTNDNATGQGREVGTANKSKRKYSPRSTATEAQIQKLLELLRIRPRHTHELRKLGISHPAGRKNDLKNRGYKFDKQLINTIDSDGFLHVGVALYSLISEPEEQEVT